MLPPDLPSMRRSFDQHGIMLCFNGPISRSLIEEVGNALRNYLAADSAMPSAAADVFAVYIEMTQNVRHYAQQRGYSDTEGMATVIVARDGGGRYVVSAGNLVELADGHGLIERIRALEVLDKAALKAAYKEQLRRPRAPGAVSGAGLGIIDIARRASKPLGATLEVVSEARGLFTLTATI